MQNDNGPDYGNGKICYVEIPANNIGESSAFYQKVFGWKVRTSIEGNTSFDDGVNQVSGMWVLGRKPSKEIGLLIYIMVDSVEEALEAVITNGGKMVQPIGMDAPEITARFSDPTGNVLGLFSERTHQ